MSETDWKPENYDQQNQPNRRSSSYLGGKYSQSPYSPRPQNANKPSPGYETGSASGRYSRNGGGGYYGNGGRPDSYVEAPQQRQRYGNRMMSDTTGMRGNGGNGVYPQHGYHQSHDTVMTGGSDSTGPWGNSTDPSSENSSLDRINATSKPHQDMYGGSNGYGQPNGYPRAIPEDGAYQQNSYGGPVQPPNGGARKPIPLGSSGDVPAPPRSSLPSNARPEPEKKKGWLSRKFSKKG